MWTKPTDARHLFLPCSRSACRSGRPRRPRDELEGRPPASLRIQAVVDPPSPISRHPQGELEGLGPGVPANTKTGEEVHLDPGAAAPSRTRPQSPDPSIPRVSFQACERQGPRTNASIEVGRRSTWEGSCTRGDVLTDRLGYSRGALASVRNRSSGSRLARLTTTHQSPGCASLRSHPQPGLHEEGTLE